MKSQSSFYQVEGNINPLQHQQTMITKVCFDEMEPLLDQQHKLYEFINRLDESIEKRKYQQQLLLSSKHIRIIAKLEDIRKKIKYFETLVGNIDEILNENVDIKNMKIALESSEKWLDRLFKISQDIIKKIQFLKEKHEFGKKTIQQRKIKLNSINHHNIQLSASMIKMKKILNDLHICNDMDTSLNNRTKSLNASGDSKDILKYSKTPKLPYIHNKYNLRNFSKKTMDLPSKLKPYRNFDMENPYMIKKSHTLNEHTIASMDYKIDIPDNKNELTTRKSELNEFDTNITTTVPIYRLNEASLIENIVDLHKEMNVLKNKNSLLRNDMMQNIAAYTLFIKLFEDCYKIYYNYLFAAQQKSNDGMNGSLLFNLLLQDQNMKDKSNLINDSSMINFFKNKKIGSIGSSEYESSRLIYKTLRKIEYSNLKKKIKNKNPIKLLEQEEFLKFEPIQIFGVILLKPEIFVEVHIEFEKKNRDINMICERIKLIGKR